MKRLLLTGMSGSGKSTVINALAARGYKAVDLDCDTFSEWVELDDAATYKIDSSASVDEVVAAVLRLVE